MFANPLLSPKVPVLAALLVCLVNLSEAGTITFGGSITQPQDQSEPASFNPSLNNIAFGAPFTVTLTFVGAISGPGTYSLTGVSFNVPSAPATESSFSSATLTIIDAAGFDQFSLLACLSSGMCGAGNQLDSNFKIPDTMFFGQNVSAIGLDQPHPLDLLEDDSLTDIQGSITTYSGPAQTAPVPEPAFGWGFGAVLLMVATACKASPKQ
jgi:hypothetical protein